MDMTEDSLMSEADRMVHKIRIAEAADAKLNELLMDDKVWFELINRMCRPDSDYLVG